MFHEMKQKKKRRITFPELEQTIRKGITTLSDELPFLQAFIFYTIMCILYPMLRQCRLYAICGYQGSNLGDRPKDLERGLQGIVNLEGNLSLLQV
jgi:hypothetical protein